MIITTATELPRLMHCFGSYNMPNVLPTDAATEAKDEGNAAHWLAKVWFDGQAPHDNMVGRKAYNGFTITDEMVEHVAAYLKALDPGEMEVNTSHAGEGWEIGGRADHLTLVNEVELVNGGNGNVLEYDHWHLTVDDFKYGHRLVRVEENWTLISHAIGWCIRNGRQPEKITLRIHQPRAYHPDGPLREWSISYAQLCEYAARIHALLSNPDNTLHTSVEHCAKCHALPTCPAARMASMNAIDASCVTFNDELPNDVLTHELETLRSSLTMIENRRDALEELIIHKIKSGAAFEGYGLKQRYGQSRFKIADGKLLSALTGVDCVKAGTITPAEAKRRGVSEAVLATLTERPVIGAKLERVNIDRAARAAFGDKTP